MTTVTRPQTEVNTDGAGLLERYRPLIWGTAKRWAQRDGIAIVEDIAQEVSLALWQYHQQHPDAPSAHLKLVAHDAAREALGRGSSVDRTLPRDRLRTWKMVSMEILQENEAGWNAVEGTLVRRRRHGEIPFPTEELALARMLYQELCRQLTSRQRQILDLWLTGCSRMEVCRVLGLGLSSNGSYVSRTTKIIQCKLRGLLEDRQAVPGPDPELFATATEAARELGLSKGRVCRLCQEGKVSGARLVERPDRRGLHYLIPKPVRRINGQPSAPETAQGVEQWPRAVAAAS